MADPAYLRALKEYSRDQFGTPEDVVAAEDALMNESDRVALLLSGTGVEDAIEFALLRRLPHIKVGDDAYKLLFGAQGAAGTFSGKTILAYGMGIIDKAAKKEIDLIRELRNACAHSRKPVTLSVPCIADVVKVVLGEDDLETLKDHEPRTLRLAFCVKCGLIQQYVLHGTRKSIAEAYGV